MGINPSTLTDPVYLAQLRARNLAKNIATGVLGAVAIEGELESIGRTGRPTLIPIPGFIGDLLEAVAREAEEAVGKPIFQTIFGAALGPNVLQSMEANAPAALGMVQRIIGFTVGLPFGTSKTHDALKALLGDHAPNSLLEAIEKLPAELGMNFFIPQIMSSIVDVATGVPLREAIAEQTRPFRLEWPQLRALTRLHVLTQDELLTRFRKIGVPEDLLPLMLKLDQQLLPVGDLQQAYLSGIRDENWVRDQLDKLGFDSESVDVIVQLYLKRAETAGGDMLRAIAKKGYQDDHLTEDQYVAILKRVNVPQASIDLELEASRLEKEWTIHQLTVAEIKSLVLDQQYSDAQAVLALLQLNYAERDAQALVLNWHKTQPKPKTAVAVSQVLGYLIGGVLTATEAYDRLLATGMKSDDAKLLVQHPEHYGGVYRFDLNPKTIVAAYKDGVLEHDVAKAKLDAIHVAPQERDLLLATAAEQIAKGSKVKAPKKSIGEPEVKAALKQGLATPTWAVRELKTLGYSDQDAQLIVAVELTTLTGKVPQGWSTLT